MLNKIEEIFNVQLFSILANLVMKGGELLFFEVHAKFEELVEVGSWKKN